MRNDLVDQNTVKNHVIKNSTVLQKIVSAWKMVMTVENRVSIVVRIIHTLQQIIV